MKSITPFKVALGLSVAIHVGILAGIYAGRPPSVVPPQPLESGVEIEIVSAPEEPTPPLPRRDSAIPTPAAQGQSVPASTAIQPSIANRTEIPLAATPVEAPARVSLPEPAENTSAAQSQATAEPPARPGTTAITAETGGPTNYLFNPPPAYPAEARHRRQAGLVVLTVQVEREGLPSSVQVRQSSGSASRDRAAVDAVRSWRFTPAKLGILTVASQIEVPVRFKLSK